MQETTFEDVFQVLEIGITAISNYSSSAASQVRPTISRSQALDCPPG